MSNFPQLSALVITFDAEMGMRVQLLDDKDEVLATTHMVGAPMPNMTVRVANLRALFDAEST